MPEAYLLSESDRRAIQGLLDEYKSRRGNTSNRSRTDTGDTEGIAPEVYIAKTPISGIPALIVATEDVGTGTGTFDTDTGTGEDEFDRPGSVKCIIYRMVLVDNLPFLKPISGLTKTIHNIAKFPIGGNQWTLTARDKFGTWFAIPSAVSGITVNLVTNICQVANTGGGSGSPSYIPKVEYTPVTLPAGAVVGIPFCHTNPTDCRCYIRVPCCNGMSLPDVLHVTITPNADCACDVVTTTISYNNNTGNWEGSVILHCDDNPPIGVYNLAFTCSGQDTTDPNGYFLNGALQDPSSTCNPLYLKYTQPVGENYGCTGLGSSLTLEVTE